MIIDKVDVFGDELTQILIELCWFKDRAVLCNSMCVNSFNLREERKKQLDEFMQSSSFEQTLYKNKIAEYYTIVTSTFINRADYLALICNFLYEGKKRTILDNLKKYINSNQHDSRILKIKNSKQYMNILSISNTILNSKEFDVIKTIRNNMVSHMNGEVDELKISYMKVTIELFDMEIGLSTHIDRLKVFHNWNDEHRFHYFYYVPEIISLYFYYTNEYFRKKEEYVVSRENLDKKYIECSSFVLTKTDSLLLAIDSLYEEIHNIYDIKVNSP